MSTIACTKDYTITVNPGLTVSAYWTFQETGTSTDRVDSVTGVHLTPNFQSALTNETGKFGNGLGFIMRDALAYFQTATNVPALGYGSNGFSVFFWFNVQNWGNPPPFFDAYVVEPLITYNVSHGLRLQFIPDALGGQLTFSLQDDNFNTFTPASFRPALNTWYFVHVFFDPVLTQFGYSINNGSNVYDPAVGVTVAAFANGYVQLVQNWSSGDTTTNALTIDELGFKLDRNLTAAEVSILYNSGTGVTWPI